MLKIFQKRKNPQVVAKTESEVIEEIHQHFFTEVERLLENANKANSLESAKQDLVDKCVRLQLQGFHNSKEVLEAQEEIKRLGALKKENEEKRELIEAINYFSSKYINYKFITEESVLKICEKYGLIYGPVSHFTGVVPDENLKHIESFKIDDEDSAFIEETQFTYIDHARERIVSFKEFKSEEAYWGSHPTGIFKRFYTCPLEIVAPISDFNTKHMEVSKFKLSKTPPKDPIVLKPVMFKDKKYYLVVTAWGPEASDEKVVNHVMN